MDKDDDRDGIIEGSPFERDDDRMPPSHENARSRSKVNLPDPELESFLGLHALEESGTRLELWNPDPALPSSSPSPRCPNEPDENS